jgi:hypothetical protein
MGHIEQLPSGSFRVSVYAGMDPLTRRAIRLKSTVKTEQQAQIELGRLLKEASEGRTPESGATVAKLMDEYAAVAEWDVSTRQTNEGFIRRTIKPALGPMKVRRRDPLMPGRSCRCSLPGCLINCLLFGVRPRLGRGSPPGRVIQQRWRAGG